MTMHALITFLLGFGVTTCIIRVVYLAMTAVRVDKLPHEERDEPVYGFRTYQVFATQEASTYMRKAADTLRILSYPPPWLWLAPVFSRRTGIVEPGTCTPAFDRMHPALDHRITAANTTGYYALKDINDAPLRCESPLVVRARVVMWGKIIEHERGYRAEFMYPDTLYYNKKNKSVVQELARRYGVEIEPELITFVTEDEEWLQTWT